MTSRSLAMSAIFPDVAPGRQRALARSAVQYPRITIRARELGPLRAGSDAVRACELRTSRQPQIGDHGDALGFAHASAERPGARSGATAGTGHGRVGSPRRILRLDRDQ